MQRKIFEQALTNVIQRRNASRTSSKAHGTVVAIHGRKGSGKTTALLHMAEEEHVIYMSFRNLGNRQAVTLFLKQLGYDESSDIVCNWTNAFALLSKQVKQFSKILFDDFDIAMQNKEFASAFEAWRMKINYPQMFVILSATNMEAINNAHSKLFDYQVELYHYSLSEVMQMLPERTAKEALDIYAITGGVPELVSLFANKLPVWDCLINACTIGSPLLEWFPRAINETFRSPQVYYEILYAIACGNNRISEIGVATGYPYNKCDSYIKNLIAADVLEAYTMTTATNVEKTGYRFACSYYKLWMQIIYMNQTAFVAGQAAEMLEKYRSDISTIVQDEYRAACYRVVGQAQIHCRIPSNKIYDRPVDVPMGNKNFHFDYFKKNENGKGLFVKIYTADDVPYSTEEDDTLCSASAKIFPIYDGEAFVFCVAPYSKQVLQTCRVSDTFHLYSIEQLRFPAGYR